MKRQHYLFVCTNRRADGHPKGSCGTSGADEVHAALKEELGKRGLARTSVRACTTSCLDVCHLGPTIAVEPDDFFYGRVTVADIPAIVDALEKGERVERLIVPADQFVDKR